MGAHEGPPGWTREVGGATMVKKISTADVRLRIGDLLNRVALRGDEFVIERKGKPMAALVSVESCCSPSRTWKSCAGSFDIQPSASASR
jgi:prevent-host-death family protein